MSFVRLQQTCELYQQHATAAFSLVPVFPLCDFRCKPPRLHSQPICVTVVDSGHRVHGDGARASGAVSHHCWPLQGHRYHVRHGECRRRSFALDTYVRTWAYPEGLVQRAGRCVNWVKFMCVAVAWLGAPLGGRMRPSPKRASGCDDLMINVFELGHRIQIDNSCCLGGGGGADRTRCRRWQRSWAACALLPRSVVPILWLIFWHFECVDAIDSNCWLVQDSLSEECFWVLQYCLLGCRINTWHFSEKTNELDQRLVTGQGECVYLFR